jgi:hypothetical protein
MPTWRLIFLVWLVSALNANAQRGPDNTQFLRYPFDQWASENAKP